MLESVNSSYLNTFYEFQNGNTRDMVSDELANKNIKTKKLRFKYVGDGTENGEIIYSTSKSAKYSFQLYDGAKELKYYIKASNGGNHEGNTKTISAAEYEKIICVAYNMISNSMTEKQAIKEAGITKFNSTLSASIPLGIKIVENAFPEASGSMYHYGAGSGKISAEWDKYFIQTTGKKASSATGTPKTDMFTNKGIDISLKKAGGSQLMSGGQGEALATFEFAYTNLQDNFKNDTFNSDWAAITNYIRDDFIKKEIPGGINSVKNDFKAGKKSDMITSIMNILDSNKSITGKMRKLLKDNKEFKQSIIAEAMTGNSKFVNEPPKANYIMVFELDGSAELHEIDNKVIAFYANNTAFDISFKSANGRQWTALKGIVKKDYKSIINDSVEDEYSYENAMSDILDEALQETEKEFVKEIYEEYTTKDENIDEGFKDFAKGALKGIKDISKKVLNFITAFVIKIFEKIKKLFNSSLSFALSILGLEMETNSPDITFSV